MSCFKGAGRLLGVGLAVVTLATGCATAKKPGEAAAPAAAPAPAPAAAPAAPSAAASDTYTVVRGDCLWCISSQSQIYGDPYQWPLIYRANRDQIEDADLIFPGQRLTIDRTASSGLRAAADRHARTRGAWALGVIEETDRAFLSANP